MSVTAVSITAAPAEVWFLTGSQGLYGPDVVEQVVAQSRRIAETLDASPDLPVRVVWKPVLTDADSIRRQCLAANTDDACVGVIAWMHTFSPAKMWISGLDALAKPLLHLHTQANVELPWASIDMDFMNLNQAAHGDREFGYIQTRLGVVRKTVTGHVSDPAVTERVGTWVRAARGRQEQRTMRLARFGDNMRDVAVTEGDKVEAELRFGTSVNTYGVNDLVAVVDRSPTATSTRSSSSTRTSTPWCPSCSLTVSGTSRCATAHGSSWDCGTSCGTAASPRSRRTSRTSAACASCRAWPSSG